VSVRVLFIQGGGDGTHDEWDDKLADSLRRELGGSFEVRYPLMPNEDDPTEATWVPVIQQELSSLDSGSVVVGHSVGGTLLLRAVEIEPPVVRLGAIVLLAAPFAGKGGWPGDGFEFTSDLGDRLPADVPVHVFHGLADDTVPPMHADLFARAIPRAQLHPMPERDHQLGNDLREVAELIRTLPAHR
jgi:predicted alpha/beta hydrolase family esterase